MQKDLKRWVNHEDAILILDNLDINATFIKKRKAARVVNKFLAKLTGEDLKRFDETWDE